MTSVINAFAQLGEDITNNPAAWDDIIAHAYTRNAWFTPDNVRYMLNTIAKGYLEKINLESWAQNYPHNTTPKNIALIMAGNIPLAGFHDLLCVLISGHNAVVKLSSQDPVLLPFIVNRLSTWAPELLQKVTFVEKIITPDAIIATGSNNSARYFDYYFGKYPNIIRKNRNSVGIITGDETDSELEQLSDDIFLYFGLGCRSISTLMLPKDYPLDKIFLSSHKYQHYLDHNKYKNNLDYHVALYLLQKTPFLTNNLFILKESNDLAAPVGVLNYRYYSSADDLNSFLIENIAHIQCVVSEKNVNEFQSVPFGQSQLPLLYDYADNIDTMKFLTSL